MRNHNVARCSRDSTSSIHQKVMENEGTTLTFQKIPYKYLIYVRIRCEERGASISGVRNSADLIVTDYDRGIHK
jgi:hypothetical protein